MSHTDEKIVAQQTQAVAEIASYFYKKGEIQGFDSLSMEKAPTVLKSLFDSAGMTDHSQICNAIEYGVEQYKRRNGGDLPTANVVTSALYAAQQQVSEFDSAEIQGFDSIDNLHHESNTIVQAMAVVTVASLISSANPAVTYIPNTNGANLVPIVAARYAANQTIGALVEGDFVDGAKAALPYVSGRLKFALVQDGSTAEQYDVTARVAYSDFANKVPDATKALLPFVPNHVSIRVLGVEVANSQQRRPEDRTGTYTLIPTANVTIAGVDYKVTTSTVDFDNHTISVTFNNALPTGVTAYVHLVADYERKDPANKRERLLQLAGVTLKPEYGQLLAAPVSFGIEANINSLTQIANELNVNLSAAALAILQSKFYLEQTVEMLTEGRDRAIAQNRIVTFDASRGASGNLTASYNNTSQMISEVMKHVAMAQLQIRQITGGATVGFDLYVGDSAAIFFSTMPRDYFTPTNTPLAGHNEIVRIGTLSNGTNVYHSPNSNGLAVEADKTANIVLVGRGNEPVRNPFLAHIASPMQVFEARRDPLEISLAAHARIAYDVNPLSYYADQVAVISMINLPSIGV